MTEPTLVLSSKRSGEDLLVGLCGFVTSLLTAVVLWWIEKRFGFGFYTLMFWFVIPVGAFLSGFGGASGYLAGSWFFGRRPNRLLLVNVVLASVATFFLIHYLSYITLEINGKTVSDYVPFTQYLDIMIKSTSMEFRVTRAAVKAGATGELGELGYLVALLQIVGFAVGGFAVYGYLLSKPYCEKCSRYLSAKGKEIRYTKDVDGLQAATAQIVDDLRNGSIASALDHQKKFGNSRWQKDDHLRTVFAVRHCKRCENHWIRYSVEKKSGDNWEEIPELTVGGFTDQVVSL